MVGVDGVAGSLRVETRSGRIVTSSVPELAPLALAVGAHQLVLDGELVAGDGSAESFYVLSGRMAAETPAGAARASQAVPVSYVIFDVLWADGVSLVTAPYLVRRLLLEKLEPYVMDERRYFDDQKKHWDQQAIFDGRRSLPSGYARLCFCSGCNGRAAELDRIATKQQEAADYEWLDRQAGLEEDWRLDNPGFET
jgi:hypothetical protein